MDNKLSRIREVARNNGYSMKCRHVARKNMYVLSFFNNDLLDGFAFSVNVNDSDDKIFFGNVSKAIYETWKNFDVEKETEAYLAKIGCKSRFSVQENKIYMDVNHYIYNIYSMYFYLANK